MRTTKTENHTIPATYRTDSFRRVVLEDGSTEVKRWVADHQVSVQIHRTEDGQLFFRGAAL